jgi:hypothetical protein
MLELPADHQPPDSSAPRPVFGRGTLIAVGVWACVFVVFVVLGLRS